MDQGLKHLPAEQAPRRSTRRRLQAKQIGGVPDCPVVMMRPSFFNDGVKQFYANGLVMGYQVPGDVKVASIPFDPVAFPPMKVGRLIGAVEYTCLEAGEALASLHWSWLGYDDKREGHVIRGLFSHPLDCGQSGVWRFELPVLQVDFETAFNSSLRVTPMGDRIPILIRAAWLEVYGA